MFLYKSPFIILSVNVDILMQKKNPFLSQNNY